MLLPSVARLTTWCGIDSGGSENATHGCWRKRAHGDQKRGVASNQRLSFLRSSVGHRGWGACVIKLQVRNSSVAQLLFFWDKITMSNTLRLVSRFLVSEDGPA